MILDIERILSLFALFTDLPDRQLFAWRGLCAAAAGTIQGKVRADVNIKANMERLCTAAAAWAYSDYLALSAGGSGEEIRVGDISLKNSKTSGGFGEAQEIRNYFMEQIADLVDNVKSFAFRRTGESA